MQLSTLDVIFGILNENNSDPIFDAITFCILFAIYFIYRCKTQSDPIVFAHFKIKIKERLAIEQLLYVQNEKLTVFLKINGCLCTISYNISLKHKIHSLTKTPYQFSKPFILLS